MATRGKHTFPGRVFSAGAGVALIGGSMASAGFDVGTPATVVGLTWACGTVAFHGWRQGWPLFSGQQGSMARWDRLTDRHGGLASRLDLHRTSSKRAARKEALSLLPELAGQPRRVRRDVSQYSTELCRVGRQRIRTTVQYVTGLLGGPRMGKSEALMSYILDAAGAVICTSTRSDLMDVTRPKREQRGPVYVFNPGGMGGIPSSLKFDVLAGCRDFVTAQQKAEDLIGAGRDQDEEKWKVQARQIMSVFLHAAAIGEGCTIVDVLRWVANPRERLNDVRRILADSAEPDVMRLFAEQFAGLHEGGMKSIMMAIVPALGWIMDPRAMAVAAPGPDESFNVQEFIRLRGTLYILGSQETAGIVGPLVAALTAHIAREARKMADSMPRQRLNPPLVMALDEAYLICPVPLPVWTSDMGGRNIQVIWAAQEIAQLEERWGKTGSEILLSNTASLLVFGGMKHVSDNLISLCGTRQQVKTIDDSTIAERVPVFDAARIAALRRGEVILSRSGMRPALGRAPYASGRRDVRRALKLAAPAIRETNFEADAREAGRGE